VTERRPAPAIVHRSTPAGQGGVAVIELFGEEAEALLARFFEARSGRGMEALPRPGRVRFGWLRDADGEAVDEVIVARFSAAESWCGLPGCSISCHGGSGVTERAIGVFVSGGACRCDTAALLDEAWRRGALDLVRSRAYACLVDALTERAAEYFLRQYEGALSRRLRALLLRAAGSYGGTLGALDELRSLLDQAPAAIRLHAPARILIAGAANAGKSTLFNALYGRERAIVSPLPGTTRDLVEETIEIAGYPVVLIDSAGCREGPIADPVEEAGLQRVHEAKADGVLFLREHHRPFGDREIELLAGLAPRPLIVVRTKVDLAGDGAGSGAGADPAPLRRLGAKLGRAEPVLISSRSGRGIEELREAIRSAWLGPPEGVVLPALPFTGDLCGRTRRLLDDWGRAGVDLDALRKSFIECFPGSMASAGGDRGEPDAAGP
jgi:tRNA modification GTPase